MASLKVHAGDFQAGRGAWAGNSFILRPPQKLFAKAIRGRDLNEISIATEDTVKSFGGTVGWGTAGLVLLGPVGLLAGLLLGGNSSSVTFVAQFKDGRRLFATTDSKSFREMQACAF